MKMTTTAKVFLALIILAAALLAASCAGVTETGNPLPSAPFAEPAMEDLAEYVNDAFGVRIRYPVDWTFEETEDDSLVVFVSPDVAGEGMSAAEIFFEILDPAPLSLKAYLLQRYPGRIFSTVATPTLTGYLYDDPAVGPDGGDLQEYYFLNDGVFLLVAAELKPATRDDFFQLLDGIEFF